MTVGTLHIPVELVVWGIGVAGALGTAWLHDRRDRRAQESEMKRYREELKLRVTYLEEDVAELKAQMRAVTERV